MTAVAECLAVPIKAPGYQSGVAGPSVPTLRLRSLVCGPASKFSFPQKEEVFLSGPSRTTLPGACAPTHCSQLSSRMMRS